MDRIYQIGIVGGREADPGILRLAEEAGRLIARRGALLICGGMGGVMEAACRGAKSEGGTTVGILPTADRGDANPWVDVAIVTDLGVARNAVIIHSCDAVIAVGGRYGTLSEMAFARQLGKPLVSLGSWRFDASVTTAAGAEEAVARLFELLARGHSGE
ncbi:TIGR00725 family protein [bacterium]|nr:TIGR00725 family protein [bacterium]